MFRSRIAPWLVTLALVFAASACSSDSLPPASDGAVAKDASQDSVAKPDAAMSEDSAAPKPDGALPKPDATPPKPDGAPPKPDATPPKPDAALPKPDAATGGCKVDCDCNQGLLCAGGKCIVGFKPAYCCDKPGCPTGQVCTDSQGQKGICGGGTSWCKSACDCATQGQTCLAGKCTTTTTPTYCCSKTPCPKGSACQMASGIFAFCGGGGPSTCTAHCDCNQGMMCVAGSCLAGTKPVYCCSKAGCPTGKLCYDQHNTPGTCP